MQMTNQAQAAKKSTPTRYGPYVRTDFHRENLTHIPKVKRNDYDYDSRRRASYDGGRAPIRLLDNDNQNLAEASMLFRGVNFPTTAPIHMVCSFTPLCYFLIFFSLVCTGAAIFAY